MENNIQTELEKYKKVTKTIYIGAIIVALAAAVISYIVTSSDMEPTNNTIFQSIAILMMLAVIPLSLKYYKKKFVEITEESSSSEKEKIRDITKQYIIKTIANLCVMQIIAFAYACTKDASMLYCELIIGIVILFFCKPDQLEINEEVQQ